MATTDEATPASDARPGPRRSWVRHATELPFLVIFSLMVAVVIKTFLVQAFYIPSGSMLPTLQIGDRVLVEKVSYVFDEPEPGQIVVFARSVFGTPLDLPWYEDARNFVRELLGMRTAGSSEEDYIKRIVAVGGDTIRYAGKPRALSVNGEVVEEDYLRRTDRISTTLTERDCRRLQMTAGDGGCVVPPGKVFVMGDNRANSADSRSIGPVDEDKIVGRAFLVLWPPGDFGGL